MIMNITTTAANIIIKRLLLSSLPVELPATPSVVIGTCVDTAGGTVNTMPCNNSMCYVIREDCSTHMLFQIDQRAHCFQTTSKGSTCYDLISYIFINLQVQQ